MDVRFQDTEEQERQQSNNDAFSNAARAPSCGKGLSSLSFSVLTIYAASRLPYTYNAGTDICESGKDSPNTETLGVLRRAVHTRKRRRNC